MDGTQPGRGSSSDGADAGDEGEESDTGFRCRAVASDVPALLRNLYEQRDAGEVCFVRDDGAEVDRAHSAILQLQSPVLRTMLRSEMEESKSNRVKLQPDFVEALPQVLRFWYGLPISVESFESAVKLRELAEYYDTEQLKSLTIELLLNARPSASRMALVLESLSFEEHLTGRAWAYLEAHPRELFASSAWLRLSATTVADFLRRDAVLCREPALLRALARWARAREEGTTPRRVAVPEDLLRLVRFENMSPAELKSAAKPCLTPEQYVELLEEVSGATERREKRRAVRDRPRRPFRCSCCGLDVFVLAESGLPGDGKGVVTADGGAVPECRRYHPGFKWNVLTCPDHNGKCPTCRRCSALRWSCCQMAESSIGCRGRQHEWHEAGSKSGWWEEPPQKRARGK